MKKEASEYLFNEAVKYLGKYPATRKKIKEYLQKKIKNKKTYARAIFLEGVDKEEMIERIVGRLDELKIINEDQFLESMFHYYQQSLFSIRKIKNKLFQKGFDSKIIDEFIDQKFYENPELEIEILKQYIVKKKLANLDESDLKKKLYQQSFSENSIFRVIKE
ncbi:RecX family protein [alpha proteobacterium HIMB59]|nr:RecX family protein [alpha proteobacterium HIMB59]